MSQFDSNAYVGTESGTQAISRLNNSFSAHQTEHSGTSRPSYAVANMIWLDTSGTPWLLKMFDGTDDITMGEINATTNEFNPSSLIKQSGGNVGIGTSTGYTLTVQKDVDDYIAKLENDGNSTLSNGLWVDTRWNTPTNTLFKVTTNSGTSDVIVAKGDGNVGIGESAPTQKLHVTGDVVIDKTNNGYSGLRIHDDSSGDYNSYLDLGRNDGGTRLWVRRGGRTQATTPWANASATPIASFGRGGIAFGSDTAEANTLDDYEEGTWTPGIGSWNGGTWTSPTFNATYTKIGRVVTLVAVQTGGTVASGGTVKYMTGLPFAPRVGGAPGAVSNSGISDLGLVWAHQSSLIFFSDNIGTNTALSFSVTYET